jgi:osmoprotectant transport system substrate-binding protein
MRRPSVVASVVASVLLASACGSGSHRGAEQPTGTASTGHVVTVAAFNFGESQVLANLFVATLEGAGLPAVVKPMTNRETVEPALWRGFVDVAPEYTSSLAQFLNEQDNGANAPAVTSSDLAKTTAALRELAQAHHIVVLNPSRATDQNAFAVTANFARANNLRTLSDLSNFTGPLALGGPAECTSRPYCQPGLEKTYGIRFATFRRLDAGGPLTKLALKTGLVQVGLVFTSDPGLAAYGLTVLADDKQLQDADAVVPVVNADAVTPALTAALNRLMATLTTADLIELNRRVDLQHRDPAAVARDYLATKGLLPAA